VAVIDPEVTVETSLQFLITLPLALKRTFPAVETVTVIALVIPKVIVVEAKAIVAVADPVVMVIVKEEVEEVAPLLSVTVMTSAESAREVGVPEIRPVEVVRERPGGRDPVVIA
jgi:hypothetical protein